MGPSSSSAARETPHSRTAPSDPSAPLWKSLFDAFPDAQVICRADGTIEHLNAQAAAQFKAALSQAAATPRIFDLLQPPADQKVRELFQRQPATPDLLYAVTVALPGMSLGPVDLEITPLDGGLALIAFKDSSRRLRLEAHVARLITAIDATPEVFFITDADLRLTFVNPAFQIATGYGLEEVLGRTDAFLRAPGEQDKVRLYLETLAQGHEWIGELINARRDGTTYHVESNISPIFDMTGRFMGYVTSEHDITPRLRLQNELRLERDFIHSILSSLDGAIYTLDREFHLTHANEGWRRMPAEHGGIRLAGPPVMGRQLLDSVPDAARRADLEFAFREALAGGQAQENSYLSPDGRHWLTKISPWIHANEVRGLICSINDQTRYHELQDQLFQAQKMEIIGTLAAGVAHDFNNLLQAIRGNVSLVLLQTPEDSTVRHWAEQINVAASRAADIANQLLSFSRESGEKRGVLDLNQIIEEAGQLARRTLRADISFELAPSPEPLCVKVDPTRASQALLNLCVNAQDAMPAGGRLTLTNAIARLTPEQSARHGISAAQEFARCSVADTGCGITPEIMGRIFEPFFTTKEKGKGTGLGLAIVQRVMQETGGFVEVETTPGAGATFHLYFPLVREQPAASPEQSSRPLARGAGRVLVVDDLDLLRDFTKNFLETAGFTVLVASLGAEALKVLEETPEPVDILFTDYSMPGMNGVELIERVSTRWPKIRLVLASGYLDDTVRKKLDALKVSVLYKPYEMQDAAQLILSLLPASESSPGYSEPAPFGKA
jgi:PAS domain S-box-containing protein